MADPDPQHGPANTPQGPGADVLDPANQSLADALRKSFLVLKVLMVTLVILYFLSGWFSVKPDEVGFVLRFGRVVGAGESLGGAVLRPGWHWSLPYPIDRWLTVSNKERDLPIEFIEYRTKEEEVSGKLGYKYDDRLNPARDDYLITGDVNIIHGSLILKYQISDPLAYITHVHPMPRADAGITSPAYERYPEYSILTDLVRTAVVETTADWKALDARGSRQSEFLQDVGQRVSEKLAALKAVGTPLGISIDPTKGILARKSAGNEGIYPPRQVQEVFDKVFAVQTTKAKNITKASAEANEMLTRTVGSNYASVSDAVDREFQALLALSAAESAGAPETAALEHDYQEKRTAAVKEIEGATGDVQSTIKMAQIYRDSVVNEAIADYQELLALLPEYRRNPNIFLSRQRDELYATALANRGVVKVYAPQDGKEFRLKIPRSPKLATDLSESEKKMKGFTVSSTDANVARGAEIRATARAE